MGNIKLSGNLSANGLTIQTLNSNSAIFKTLTVNQNSTFNGLSLFSENVSFSKDAFVTGKLGIGVSSPAEALDVLGNIKSSAGLFSSSLNTGSAQISALNVSGNSIFNGSVGIGVATPSERLHIGGNLKVDNTIFSNALTTSSFQTGQFNASGLASFSENASFAKDLLVAGQSQLNGGATIGGNSSMNNLLVTGTLNAGNIAISEINTTGNASIGQNLTVTGAGQIGGNLNVAGQLNAQALSLSSITTSADVAVGNKLTVTGISQLNGGAAIVGNSSVNGNLQISGILSAAGIALADVNTTGSTNIAQNLSVGGLSQFGSNMNVAGNLKAGVIEATEFKLTGGGSPFNFNNAVISETLNVGADHVPENYRLAIGGKIIATGIDIKIPQKWPDYVFTEAHQRMTLKELQEYINKHGHLPGMASAQEMEEKQVYSVSDMDGKLLEKIEELTLYILELKKEINELKSEKTGE